METVPPQKTLELADAVPAGSNFDAQSLKLPLSALGGRDHEAWVELIEALNRVNELSRLARALAA